MPELLRLATRSSPQAATQAQHVADMLRTVSPDLSVEIVFVDTAGDRNRTAPMHSIGGQGVFVKEVQHAVLDGRADIAVHSAKDVPTTPTPGLTLAAFATRRNAADALIGLALDALADGATVATGSVRRAAQLRAVRPDLNFVELRGNIHTRLGKVPPEGAIVMAVAALDILQLTEHIAQELPTEQFVPAPGQGCVVLECADDNDVAVQACAAVDHAATRDAVVAERAFLAELGSGCSLPVGAYAVEGLLTGFLASGDQRHHVTRTILLGDDAADSSRRAAGLARQMIVELGESTR